MTFPLYQVVTLALLGFLAGFLFCACMKDPVYSSDGLLDSASQVEKQNSSIYPEGKFGGTMTPETDTITTFLQRMSTQDNRMTAFPFYYVIRTARWVITDEDYASGDSRIRCVHNDDHETVISEEEYDKLPNMKEDAVEDENGNEFCQDDFTRFCEVNVWQEEGMFLTETDAKCHLERNSYHYSKDAHTYVKHVWRAPELENFLRALFKHFGVEPRQDKGTM